jgi:hypothetical protein
MGTVLLLTKKALVLEAEIGAHPLLDPLDLVHLHELDRELHAVRALDVVLLVVEAVLVQVYLLVALVAAK